MSEIKTLKSVEITYVDASITKAMYAEFIVQGIMNGENMRENVSLRDIDILIFLERTNHPLSTYEFLQIVKKIKDSLDSDFAKNLLIPIAIQQHEKKTIERETLNLMAELIRPKPMNNTKLTTYNNRGEIVVRKP